LGSVKDLCRSFIVIKVSSLRWRSVEEVTLSHRVVKVLSVAQGWAWLGDCTGCCTCWWGISSSWDREGRHSSCLRSSQTKLTTKFRLEPKLDIIHALISSIIWSISTTSKVLALGNISTLRFRQSLTCSSQIKPVQNAASHTIQQFVIRLHLSHLHWLLVLPLISLVLLLESFYLFQEVIILSLKGLLLGHGILLCSQQETLLLIPFSSVSLMG